MSEQNPWVVALGDNVARVHACEPEPVAPAWAPGADVPRVLHGLPLGGACTDYDFYVVGAHGGAGTSTWARLLDAGDGGCAWPRQRLSDRRIDVVVVCRSNFAGLEAARRASMQWASGVVKGVNLAGLVVTPDAPGRLPRALREAAERAAGAFPMTVWAPWVNSWRFHERIDTSSLPRPILRALDEINSLRKEH